jgi:signal transduction histidine kinase
MHELMNALLGLSRLTRAPLRRQRVDLSALALGVAAGLREAEPARSVALSVQPGLVASGDPALLRSVLDNLLGNAWKYTLRTAEPRIEFGAEERAGEMVFRVCDNGAGFDMAYAERLFAPFQRLHEDADFPGLGVGLPTVQRIVQRHGGRVWAEATPGLGAAFYFTLPA